MLFAEFHAYRPQEVHDDINCKRNTLADSGGKRGALDAHFGESPAEDHHRVEDNVDDTATQQAHH